LLLKEIGMIDDIKFVNPKDVQDGLVEVTANDIIANVPYVKGCGLWFDHHSSEEERKEHGKFEGKSDPFAPSAARVIYDYYGGEKKFSDRHLKELIAAVDKADSADFTMAEILNPQGWVLISFLMDPRTGLGRYKDYRISNYNFMMDMFNYCRTKSVDEILEIEDVKERVDRYFEQDRLFQKMIKARSTARGNVVVLDLRDQEEIYTGNRFVLYCHYPKQSISIRVTWGLHKQNVVLTCGHSIINKTSKVDIGSMMLKYGGGGHKAVGTCQVQTEDADRILEEIIQKMNETDQAFP